MFALAHLKLCLLQPVCVSPVFVFVFPMHVCCGLYFALHISNGFVSFFLIGIGVCVVISVFFFVFARFERG